MYKDRDIGILNIVAFILSGITSILSAYYYLETNKSFYLWSGVTIPTALTYIVIIRSFKSKRYDELFKDRNGFDPAFPETSYTDLIIIALSEIFYQLFILPVYSLFANVSNKLLKASEEIKGIEHDTEWSTN